MAETTPAPKAGLNVLAGVILSGAREVLGASPLLACLKELHPHHPGTDAPTAGEGCDQLANFFSSLCQAYGEQSGRGLAQCIGRASFRHFQEAYGADLGFEGMEHRMLPVPRRIRRGLEAMAAVIAAACGVEVRQIDEPTAWVWELPACPFCRSQGSSAFGCLWLAGLMQEYCSWSTGGRYFRAGGESCLASNGRACHIRLLKTPLE